MPRATVAALIGRTRLGISAAIGPLSHSASFSLLRCGWPSAARSPASSEGRTMTTLSKPRPAIAASISPLTRL